MAETEAIAGQPRSNYTQLPDSGHASEESTRRRRNNNNSTSNTHNNGSAHHDDEADADNGYYKDKPVPSFWQRHGWNLSFFLLAFSTFAVVLLLTIYVIVNRENDNKNNSNSPTIPLAEQNNLAAGQARCAAIRATLAQKAAFNVSADRVNERGVPGTTFITNATIYIGNGTTLLNANILVRDGVISDIGPNVARPDAVDEVIDASGFFVTPGIVDLHSHMGVNGFPQLNYNDDTNEATNPIFPQVRSIDGFDPRDPAIAMINSGGVTTSLILPGSANIIGGEAFVAKHRGKTIEELRVQTPHRFMKMACGENPKRVYGGMNRTPDSRMGSAYLLRQRLADATKLVTEQNSWCDSPDGSIPFPDDLALDSLSDLVRGNVNLNVHCYEVRDLEMIIRVAHEFNITVAAFHHALAAYLIPDIIRESNISIAGFVDHWGFKKEGFDGSVYAPKILTENGARFIIKSDHPVTNARFLMNIGMIAYHYGHSEQDVIASLTRLPALSAGLDYRIGTLEVGKDADIVIWDRRPVEAGASPLRVIVDGATTFVDKVQPLPARLSNTTIPLPGSLCKVPTNASFPPVFIDYPTYVLQNISFIVTLDPTVGTLLSNATASMDVVVSDDTIICVGICPDIPEDAEIFPINGGVLVPSAIAVGGVVGLVEIPTESSTYDGDASGDFVTLSTVQARNGIRTAGKHAYASAAGGTLIAVTPPGNGDGFVRGLSTAATLGIEVAENGILKDVTALHISIGADARSGGLTDSISGQLQELSNLLASANATANITSYTTNGFASVVNGTIPLIVSVNQADLIASVVRIVKPYQPALRLVISGAVEAELVADQLYEANATVLLSPQRCSADTFETLRCSNSTMMTLSEYRIPVGLGPWDTDNTRHLFIEAAWALEARWGGFDSVEKALATVTSIPAAAAGIDDVVGSISVGKKAFWTLFAGEPLRAGPNGFQVAAVAHIGGIACAVAMP